MSVYYNDSEPFVCDWLENLMREKLIPEGVVDRRPIQEVEPKDVQDFTQCHFFAGIGGWAYALQLAGWGDRPVWTGSCPCQPFSAAGKRGSHADERHLWPAWCHLIRECHPVTIFGEQVSGAAGLGWLDAVALDLEAADYAVGACVLGAHSVGAPHLRQRLYFVGVSDGARRSLGVGVIGNDGSAAEQTARQAALQAGTVSVVADAEIKRRGEAGECSGRCAQRPRDSGEPLGLADAKYTERGKIDIRREDGCDRPNDGRQEAHCVIGARGEVRSVAHPERRAAERRGHDVGDTPSGVEREAREWERLRLDPWAGCEFIPCRDGKARPVEPGTFPLAHGVPARVGRLRAYGNAIVPQVAAAFVRAYLEVRP